MYFFLGIVAQEDLVKGYIVPSYILCQSHGKTESRSGWRVVKQNEDNPMISMNKVLVTSFHGHDDMIDFLCSYRTRDHMHGDKHYTKEQTKKYYPRGGLFWFECTVYGEPLGPSLFITRVPRKEKRGTDGGFQRLKEAQSRIPDIVEVLSRDFTTEPNPHSYKKSRLVQRRSRNGSKGTRSKGHARVQSSQQD